MINEERILSIVRNVIDSIPFTIAVDAEGNVVSLNKAYADYLEIDYDTAIGKYITEVVPTSGLVEVLKTKKKMVGDLFRLKNGEEIIVSRFPIFDEQNNFIGAISTTIFEDLDEIDNLKNEIRNLKEENEIYKRELRKLKTATSPLDNLVGESEIMLKIKHEIERIAPKDVGVLITGETGSGKEIIANAIHQMSERKNQPFIKINCAAIPSELMESELFGYEAGAFSGANRHGKIGKFELANNGTILLDEIGEMSLSLQAKLLRVLQENEIEKIGGTKSKKIDVRVICSTNRNLEKMIDEGQFRADLYYRINIMEITMPPLRERKLDIPILCEKLISENNIKDKTDITGVSDEALNMFYCYDWIGNVRELKHVLERAGIIAQIGLIKQEHLDFFLPKIKDEMEKLSIPSVISNSIYAKRSILEREAITRALQMFDGNKSKAAEYLQISRSTLYEKMKIYNI